MFDIEEEGYLKQEEISETNVTTRSQGLIKEDMSVFPKIKKFQENMKKNLEEHKMEYNIVEDIKRAKANI